MTALVSYIDGKSIRTKYVTKPTKNWNEIKSQIRNEFTKPLVSIVPFK
jgi:hypothetical protein